ncbi:VIT domain-containing protein [Sphingobacterium sp. UBA5670]|uniref:VIT domain-containing protein n=1 Tax=Sphingobacterium sp. UBA5670 TaxID=1947502 RepID=UPI0025E73D94|nr:VIT domain-containing protein [Sphingobacterium sp. UBA5670]
MKKIIVALFIVLVFSNVDTKSQIRTTREIPSLKIKNDDGQQNKVMLADLKVDVAIFGNMAKTTMTMVFENKTNRDLEGELTFPMPEGVSVSGYALDINGKLRQAVAVDKNKGTEVFESIETRRVDPGLLEKVEGNNFRTRIYPLPAKGKRTIQISYSENLGMESDQAHYYYLPLNYTNAIENFALDIHVFQDSHKPDFTEKPDGSLAFSHQNNNYTASLRKQQFQSQRNLVIQLPIDSKGSSGLIQANNDKTFYFLANASVNSVKPTQKKWGEDIGIIWDRSLSGKNRDIEKELALLDLFFKQNPNMRVELGLLDIQFLKGPTFHVRQGNWDELKSYIKRMDYDGGTDYSQLKTGVIHASDYLLFSDGLSTFGQSEISLENPVYCITSSNGSDYGVLKQIAQKHIGKMINLTNTSVNQAYNNLNTVDLLYLGIKEQHDFEEVYPQKGTAIQANFSIAGIGKRPGLKQLTLLVGDGQHTPKEISITLHPDHGEIDLQQIWAQKKIEALDLQYDNNREEIETLGKQFGIVTRNTSLIVLENVEDYIRYAITPPAELLPQFNALQKEHAIEREERVANLLDKAENSAEQLRSWWQTNFQQKKKYPQRDKPLESTDYMAVEEIANGATSVTPIPSRPSASPVAAARAEELRSSDAASGKRMSVGGNSNTVNAATSELAMAAASDDALQESVVVQSLEERVAGVQTGNSINNIRGKISIPEIKEDQAYLQELNQSKDPYKSYLQLRNQYMGTPTFYFDVANFFYKRGNKQKALLILSALADLQIENADLYKTISYKLREWGDYDNALFITAKVLKWRSMDPQSHRDYALVLQDKGMFKEALEQLYGILTQSYSPEAADRDEGIEETLLMEINNIIKSNKAASSNVDVNKKLIADLPVDMRVVINWNSQNTDIDLWVTDPNQEKCFYSNPATAIGGRLSNDFTGGYGPEQFLLKKALKGKYKIEVDFFNDGSLTLAGPAAVMAEIYTYYSSGKQERKIVTIYLDRDKERNVGIGEFSFQ